MKRKLETNMDALLCAIFPSDYSIDSPSSTCTPGISSFASPASVGPALNEYPHKKRIAISDLLQSSHHPSDSPLLAESEISCTGSTCSDYEPSELTVTVSYAKCAQKSYGNEKRFLCPPPIVRTNSDSVKMALSTSSPGLKPESNDLIVTDATPLKTIDNSQVFRHLFVSSGSKAKSFSLNLNINDCMNLETGCISMISKPSKKKFQKDALLIRDGDFVSLFNRINSQTVRTRYVHHSGQNPFFTAQYNAWTPLRICVDSKSQAEDGSIRFGSVVILTDAETGTTLERLVILKVEKNSVLHDFTGPVGQMSKICLMRESMPGVYLSTPFDSISKRILHIHGSDYSNASGDSLVFGKTQLENDASILSDSMIWTVTAVETLTANILL